MPISPSAKRSIWQKLANCYIFFHYHTLKAWAHCGAEIIEWMEEENFGVTPSDLTLVCLFN